MSLAATAAVALVAGLHVAFAALEMLFWTKPLGRKVFGTRREEAEATKVLAANQGLYNLFLVAGLVWGLVLGPAGEPQQIFFLGCVIVAGVFGAATASWQILMVQALPAFVALTLVLLA